MNRQMSLGAFFHPTGNHVAAWLHPGSQVDAGTNVDHYIAITRTAERGCFDMVFLADAMATRDGKPRGAEALAAIHGVFRADHAAGRTGHRHQPHRPRLHGQPTSYNEPYDIARRFASLEPHQQGADRLERGDVGQPDRGVQLRARRTLPARRTVRARAGVRRRGARPVGQLGGRRLPARPGERRLLRPRQAALPCTTRATASPSAAR